MRRLVLDTSVVAKWFLKEKDSMKAKSLLDAYTDGDIDIFIPGLLPYELANALWKRQRDGLTQPKAQKAYSDFLDLEIEQIENVEIIAKALALAFRYEIAVYDAVFIALAKELNCDLITADEVLWRNVRDTEPRVKLLSSI